MLKQFLWVISAGAVLILFGLFIRFYDGKLLSDFFYADTGRLLLRFVYSDSLILSGVFLGVWFCVHSWLKNLKQSLKLTSNSLWILFFAIFLWIRCFYLAHAWFLAGSLGFPLDDAWIHAVYAKNFSQTLTLGFVSGVTDAGTSSPLWSILLAAGANLDVAMIWNVHFWSNLCWLGAFFTFFLLAKQLLQDFNWVFLVVLIISVEPMLVWSSLAGLETGLFSFLIYLALYFYGRSETMKWLAAVLAGLSGLVRAEGWILVGVFLVIDVVRKRTNTRDSLLRLGLSVLIILPWIAHNYMANGTPLPQTFYAKSSSFTIITIMETLRTTLVVMLSPGLWVFTILLPLAIWGWLHHKKGFGLILPMIVTMLLYWCSIAVTIGIFANNHRYIHPFIPVFILFVLTGFYYSLDKMRILRYWLTTGVVLVVFMTGILSSVIYGYGVKNIEEQQVVMAVWVRDNVPDGVTVAANDVGVLGYYSEHEIYDLCGLVGEGGVVMRPNATWDDLISRGIHWAAIYPEWFPKLSADPAAIKVAEFNVDRAVTVGGKTAVVFYHP